MRVLIMGEILKKMLTKTMEQVMSLICWMNLSSIIFCHQKAMPLLSEKTAEKTLNQTSDNYW